MVGYICSCRSKPTATQAPQPQPHRHCRAQASSWTPRAQPAAQRKAGAKGQHSTRTHKKKGSPPKKPKRASVQRRRREGRHDHHTHTTGLNMQACRLSTNNPPAHAHTNASKHPIHTGGRPDQINPTNHSASTQNNGGRDPDSGRRGRLHALRAQGPGRVSGGVLGQAARLCQGMLIVTWWVSGFRVSNPMESRCPKKQIDPPHPSHPPPSSSSTASPS